MSSVTIFVAKELKNPQVARLFAPALEKLLNELTGQSRISVDVSDSPSCTPDVCLAMYDFGGFGEEKMGEIKRKVRKLTRQHFGIGDHQISLTMQGTFVL